MLAVDVQCQLIIFELLGGKTVNSKRPGEPDVTFANIRKIKKLNWKPVALRMVLNYF